MQGKFKPRREVVELSVTLGNKYHPGRVRGISSKLGLKHGIPQEVSSYRTRQHHKDDLFDTLSKKANAYIDEKINQLKASQGLSTVEPTSSLVPVQSSVASITLETFPVHTIDRPTPCALHISYNRKGKTVKVTIKTAYPGRTMHSNVFLDDYSRVEVLLISPNHLDYEVEIPSPDGETVLGNLVAYFIVWQQRDIVLLTTLLGAPSTSRQLQLLQVEEQAEIDPKHVRSCH
jgi:hypothetical protein